MTRDMITAMKDDELAQVIAWAQEEQKRRVETRKRETIAKIKKLAREVGVSVNLAGQGKTTNKTGRFCLIRLPIAF